MALFFHRLKSDAFSFSFMSFAFVDPLVGDEVLEVIFRDDEAAVVKGESVVCRVLFEVLKEPELRGADGRGGC